MNLPMIASILWDKVFNKTIEMNTSWPYMNCYKSCTKLCLHVQQRRKQHDLIGIALIENHYKQLIKQKEENSFFNHLYAQKLQKIWIQLNHHHSTLRYKSDNYEKSTSTLQHDQKKRRKSSNKQWWIREISWQNINIVSTQDYNPNLCSSISSSSSLEESNQSYGFNASFFLDQ